MSILDYKTWMKFKDEFYNRQIEFCNIEEQFKEKSYQLKLAEMRLQRKMYEHLVSRSKHLMKEICEEDMDFEFCPNCLAKRTIVNDDISFYDSGILLNKKNIDSNKVDFMAFWITKVENWDQEELWYDCEIELSQFKPISYIDNDERKHSTAGLPVDVINSMVKPNGLNWNILYMSQRNSVTEELDFRFIVKDEGDDEHRGDKELKDVLQQLYNRYKSEKFDKRLYRLKIIKEI